MKELLNQKYDAAGWWVKCVTRGVAVKSASLLRLVGEENQGTRESWVAASNVEPCGCCLQSARCAPTRTSNPVPHSAQQMRTGANRSGRFGAASACRDVRGTRQQGFYFPFSFSFCLSAKPQDSRADDAVGQLWMRVAMDEGVVQ